MTETTQRDLIDRLAAELAALRIAAASVTDLLLRSSTNDLAAALTTQAAQHDAERQALITRAETAEQRLRGDIQ